MKTKLIIFLSLFITFLTAQETNQNNNITNIRSQIESLIKQGNSNIIKAQKLFKEAQLTSQQQTTDINKKLLNLKNQIKAFSKLKNANKKGLKQAGILAKEAENQINEYKYDEADTTITSALGLITVVPVISLKINPVIFSPDGDGYADTLHIYSKVFAKSEIIKWDITIYQQIDKNGKVTNIPVKTASGTGHPKEHLVWKGIMDDKKTVADSASSYQILMRATDKKGGTGISQPIKFQTDIFVIKTARGLMIDISSITFDLGKANIKKKYVTILKQLYEKLTDYPDYTIIVEGHSDSTGKAPFNKTLSQKRADSVMKYLIKLGINSSKLKSYGIGEALPKTLLMSKIDLNRRVNFILLKSKKNETTYQKFINKLDINKEVEMKNDKKTK